MDRFTGWLQVILRWVGRHLQKFYQRVMAVPFIRKHKKLLAVMLVLLLAWGIVGALMTGHGIHDPVIIGHRGSAEGVENTLEAIQHAIDAGADYAEVDVLLSADGVPMVIHDDNLKRLSGRDVNVHQLTAAELQTIPLEQGWFTGTISTLEEVVAYRVYGNMGQLNKSSLREMDIDFLLIEEWMVSRQTLKACRSAWLPVYVWTVNDPEKMADYLQMGVVGLVTDHPSAAVEIVGTMYNLDERQMPYEIE